MKKIGLSLSVIVAFLLYSWHQQNEVAQSPVVGSGSQSSASASQTSSSTTYKNGTYTGSPADAFYGTIQVQATVSNGKISNIQFLQAPNDRGTSIAINQQADPMLSQEAIQAQSSQVNIISGATDSSQAFIQSLADALSQAK